MLFRRLAKYEKQPNLEQHFLSQRPLRLLQAFSDNLDKKNESVVNEIGGFYILLVTLKVFYKNAI